MNKKTKLRPFYLAKILYEMTDEENPLSTAELIQLMEDRHGIRPHRTTISSDIKQLKELDIDIITIESRSNKYFIGQRLFELPEIKLLIDAVESSKFITKQKSKDLVVKLGRLTSENKALGLKRNLCIEGRTKPANEQIYYIMDAINDAINSERKISFQYLQYNIRKEQELQHDGQVYIFSPYTLVWNGDYYYVLGYSEKHQDIGSYRVERIYKTPKILKEKARPIPPDFDISEYVKTMFRMYKSEKQKVELICDKSLMNTIIDYFGEEVESYAYNLSSFRIVVEVAVSHVFFSWVFGFGGKVEIKGPQSVKEEYTMMVKKAYKNLLDLK